MTSLYGFRGGPTYRPGNPQDRLMDALDEPMSIGSTFFDQAKGGVVESFGLGTVIRDATVPQGNTSELSNMERAGKAVGQLINPLGAAVGNVRRLMGDAKPSMTEEAYKASPYFRESVPWDASMTEDRAAALATQWDTKAVRDFYAEKRPITSFFGNLAGQAVDPINYVPVTGPAVRAAAVAKFGTVKGIAANAALDASLNTAIAGMATRETRRSFGDDVSWEAMVSEIATAALIGGAFGTVGGVLERRAGSRAATVRQETEQRLSTLRTVQESRVALNEAIGGLANDGEIRLSPNATEPMARIQEEIIAYHGSPHRFDKFSVDKIGTGEGAQVFGRGLYFAESAEVARKYRDDLALPSTPENDVAKSYLRDAGGDVEEAVLRVEAHAKETQQDLSAVVKKLREDSGSLYEVAIRANKEELLDWDLPLSEQSPKIQAALSDMKPEWTGAQIYESSRLVPGDFMDKQAATDALRKRGVVGIRYLDGFSRDKAEGTRNLVIFDDGQISIRSRNGQPIDASPARPDPIPEGRIEAESRTAKPDDYKALASQYRVDPETGKFDEEIELRQLDTEGRLTEEDAADMAAADETYQDSAAYGEALKTAVGCLL